MISKLSALHLIFTVLCMHATAVAQDSLLPVKVGNLSNGTEVVFNITVATRKSYFPIVDWIIPAPTHITIQTATDEEQAWALLNSRTDFDRRFVDGAILTRHEVVRNSYHILGRLNDKLPRLLGSPAYKDMKGPFVISLVLNIDPYAAINRCGQYWASLLMRAPVAPQLKVYSTTSLCNEGIMPVGEGSLNPTQTSETALSLFAREPFTFIEYGLATLKDGW